MALYDVQGTYLLTLYIEAPDAETAQDRALDLHSTAEPIEFWIDDAVVHGVNEVTD